MEQINQANEQYNVNLPSEASPKLDGRSKNKGAPEANLFCDKCKKTFKYAFSFKNSKHHKCIEKKSKSVTKPSIGQGQENKITSFEQNSDNTNSAPVPEDNSTIVEDSKDWYEEGNKEEDIS